MRLWVTRPEPDATALKMRLLAQGHEVVIEPLMWIDYSNADPIELDGAQALIATSRNAVRGLAQSEEIAHARVLPLFVVGPGTEAAAREHGFEVIIRGGGRAGDLVAAVLEHAEVNGGPLLHLAGEAIAHDIAEELRQLGFAVMQPTVYAARLAERLSAAFLPKLVLGEIDGVILLSARTAKTYVRLVEAHQLVRSARKLQHFCLSEAVADMLEPLQPHVIKVPDRPNIHEILALTDETAAHSDKGA
jgi:uroporphyrinogen-III synthase